MFLHSSFNSSTSWKGISKSFLFQTANSIITLNRLNSSPNLSVKQKKKYICCNICWVCPLAFGLPGSAVELIISNLKMETAYASETLNFHRVKTSKSRSPSTCLSGNTFFEKYFSIKHPWGYVIPRVSNLTDEKVPECSITSPLWRFCLIF